MTVPVSEALKLRQGAPIDLYTIDLNPIGTNEVYRFCNFMTPDGEAIGFGANEFPYFPIVAEGFERNTQGKSPTPQLRVANVASTITLLLLQHNDLVGAKFTRQKTYEQYLNHGATPDSTMEFERSIWFIDRKVSESKIEVTLELSSALDLYGYQLPGRLIVADTCQWVYRSAECGYAGTSYFDASDNVVGSLAQDVCGKRYSSCEKRFGAKRPTPFGAFPGAANTNIG